MPAASDVTCGNDVANANDVCASRKLWWQRGALQFKMCRKRHHLNSKFIIQHSTLFAQRTLPAPSSNQTAQVTKVCKQNLCRLLRNTFREPYLSFALFLISAAFAAHLNRVRAEPSHIFSLFSFLSSLRGRKTSTNPLAEQSQIANAKVLSLRLRFVFMYSPAFAYLPQTR